MKVFWNALRRLLQFVSRLRNKPRFTAIDSEYVKEFPWLQVSYFLNGSIHRVHNPFCPSTYLVLDSENPRGRADWNQNFQLYERGRAEQYGPWDAGSLWSVNWETWVKYWIEAIATRKQATVRPGPAVCEMFGPGQRGLYRPLINTDL